MLTTTHTLLLDALRDPSNDAVWSELYDPYRPVLVRFTLERLRTILERLEEKV